MLLQILKGFKLAAKNWIVNYWIFLDVKLYWLGVGELVELGNWLKGKTLCILAIGEISNVTTNKFEFTLVYVLSGSLVPLIRLACLIPFGRRICGNWVTIEYEFSPRNSPILPTVEYNRVHQLRIDFGILVYSYQARHLELSYLWYFSRPPGRTVIVCLAALEAPTCK